MLSHKCWNEIAVPHSNCQLDGLLTDSEQTQVYSMETEYLQAEYTQCGTVLKVWSLPWRFPEVSWAPNRTGEFADL